MKSTLLPNTTTATGYDKRTIAIGTVVLNIESGWTGRVFGFEQIDDQVMIHCYHECGGQPEADDHQWHSPEDCMVVDRKLTRQPLWEAMKANPDAWIETTKEMAYEMLGALPPIGSWGRFMVSEPVRDNDEGEAVYAAFKIVSDRHFARYLTLRQFRNAE